MDLRRFHTFVEETFRDMAQPRSTALRKVAVVAVISNPYVGRDYSETLDELVGPSAELGARIAAMAVAQMEPHAVESYGKAALVGTAGEQEHGVACLTTVFGNALRDAAGGGQAWISSFTKRCAPGESLDIPLAHKDALYVRSHYDGMTVSVPDAPLADEICVACCFANRGRLNHRVGGLAAGEIAGSDGLR